MENEHRQRLRNRLTPIHLYKITPKTNCGECGYPACLAFASHVAVGLGNMDACPYLDPKEKEQFRDQLTDQHQRGIGLKQESFEKALNHLRGEILKWDFRTIADSLGGVCMESGGKPALELSYFGRGVKVTHDDIVSTSGEEFNPWEKILLYNYVIGGATTPSGNWVGMESLPNSVSKIKSLRAHCEEKLAAAFAGKIHLLPAATAGLNGRDISEGEDADFAAEFSVLPRLSIRVLWWDEDTAEDFPARTKFVFDSRVLQVLDLESLIFACEQLTDRLLDAAGD